MSICLWPLCDDLILISGLWAVGQSGQVALYNSFCSSDCLKCHLLIFCENSSPMKLTCRNKYNSTKWQYCGSVDLSKHSCVCARIQSSDKGTLTQPMVLVWGVRSVCFTSSERDSRWRENTDKLIITSIALYTPPPPHPFCVGPPEWYRTVNEVICAI